MQMMMIISKHKERTVIVSLNYRAPIFQFFYYTDPFNLSITSAKIET